MSDSGNSTRSWIGILKILNVRQSQKRKGKKKDRISEPSQGPQSMRSNAQAPAAAYDTGSVFRVAGFLLAGSTGLDSFTYPWPTIASCFMLRNATHKLAVI